MPRLIPTVAQAMVMRDNHRFRSLVAGRRFGKSWMVAVELYRFACKDFNQLCWYIGPSFQMARDIIWLALLQLIPREMMSKAPNESRLEIYLINGSRICVKGAHNENSLVGRSLNFVAFDEFGLMSDKVFPLVRPALSDCEGHALFVTSPRGYNHAYDEWYLGSDIYVPTDEEMTMPGWQHPHENHKSFQFTTLQGGQVSREEILLARIQMDEKLFSQEYLGAFTSLSGLVYSNFDPMHNLDDSLAYNPDKVVCVGMDFNVSKMCATLAHLHNVKTRDGRRKQELGIFDEIVIKDSNTTEMCLELENRFKGKKVIVYPDASGDSNKTSAKRHETDHAIIRGFGFDVVSDASNPYVSDRVSSMQAAFKNKNGDRSLFIHPKCRELIKGLNGLTYKEKTTLVDKSLDIDHAPDAAGYMLHKLFPVACVKSSAVHMGL